MLKVKVMLPIAILSGIIATYGVYQIIEKKDVAPQVQEVAKKQIVVATANLPMGRRLAAGDLQIAEWPADMVPRNSYQDVGMILGRVLRAEIYAGEAVLDRKLAPEGSDGGFSSIIPQGMRALTVSVDTYSGVSGFILPNTRVDVLVTVSDMMKQENSITKIILEDVKVLAVDQEYERKDDDPVKVQAVTLLVDPMQAERLALASTEGKLQLSLRNTTDHSKNETQGVRLSELVARPQNKRVVRSTLTQAQKMASAPRVVEMIRSNKRTEIKFKGGVAE